MITKDKITAKLAIRNVSRRKATVLIVISGLFIRTGMISDLLVTSDTLNAVVTHTAISAFGAVDEGICHSQLGSFSLFNYSIYDQYREKLSAIPNVAGVTPMIIWSVSPFRQ
jgi:hypothetical protein